MTSFRKPLRPETTLAIKRKIGVEGLPLRWSRYANSEDGSPQPL